MFRHSGKGRTFRHNMRLASALSTVAGMVNITGVLAVKTLTTNVTGHFAFFSEELFLGNYVGAWTALAYILCFLLGAFTCSVLMEGDKISQRTKYILPISLEIVVLLHASFFDLLWGNMGMAIPLACSLLFAMGLQNALVTRVSQSVVRTTHLTGLFTDLGIEIPKLLFYKTNLDNRRVRKSILLKLMIIAGFFIGGIVGGFMFAHLKLRTLLIPVAILLFAMTYDYLLFQFYHIRRRLDHKH